jgi:CheY-like chemotaxis protein
VDRTVSIVKTEISMSESPSLPADRPLAGLRILLVEDNDDSRELMTELLAGAGAVVSEAATVREAWQKLEAGLPDVIVSDIGLPGEDGYSFMMGLRARGPGAGGAIPSVAVTAYSSPEARLKAERSGFSALVPKPVFASHLLATIAALALNAAPP